MALYKSVYYYYYYYVNYSMDGHFSDDTWCQPLGSPYIAWFPQVQSDSSFSYRDVHPYQAVSQADLKHILTTKKNSSYNQFVKH